jgi:hypothetical protein
VRTYIFSLLLSALLKAAFIFYNSTPAGRPTDRPAKPAPREEVMVVREHDQKAMSYLNSPTHISVCRRRCCRFDRLTHQNISPARGYIRERQLNKVIFYTAVTSKRRRTKLYTFMRERDAVPRDMYNTVWSCLLFVPDHFKYIFISNTSISHNRFLIPHPLAGCFLLDYIINPAA